MNSVKIIIGVDPHKDAHAAVAINGIGIRLGTLRKSDTLDAESAARAVLRWPSEFTA
jgi:hypothetical protein